MRLLLFTLTVLLACAASSRGSGRDDGGAPPEPGVGRDLARRRATHYRGVRYALDLSLRPGADFLDGAVRISLTLDNPTEDLVLDWRVLQQGAEARERVSEIYANDRPVADARFANDHIVIPLAHLRAGENVLRLKFRSPVSTSGSAVTRYRDREDQSEYVYTLFVPSDASTAFPCFDQPDLKARFTLTLAAPAGWTVVSNAPAETVTRGGGESSLWRFGETRPLSTYQFAFAAGPFVEFAEGGAGPGERAAPRPSGSKKGRRSSSRAASDGSSSEAKSVGAASGMRVFVRRSKAERARRELGEVFRLNREGLKFFEEYFGHEFPFPKYDMVIVPEFAYGGMEHAGATFLREEAVLFPSDPTAADVAVRAELMLHELAHQWFGDLVTMRWFDDLWLKEGFATFMAYKAAEALMPGQQAWKVFHLRTKPLAYLTDVTKGTTPIWQEIPNLSAAKSAYGNIVYRKAPAVLRQAEFYLGADAFRRAIRLLVKEHAYANAEWADLVGAFERASGRKLGAWADAWVKRRGMPDVRVKWEADRRGRISRLRLEQTDVLGEGGAWPMRIKLLLAPARAGRRPETLDVTLSGDGATEVREAVGRRRPSFVFANYEDYGYGRFLLDDASRAAVLKNFGAVTDEFLRTLLWGALWEGVREAEAAPLEYIDLAVRHAGRERDDVTLQSVLARVQTAFARYLSAEQQREVAPRLEAWLTSQMLTAETAGLRITYYRTFREVATTPGAFDKLEAVLTGALQVPGMTLRSRDRFDIARTLFAGRFARAEALFKEVVGKDASDDGRRYAYAAEAARPAASVKKKYFDDFLNDAALAESWIEAAVGPFNAPQQSELTLPYLAPALARLPALKRTRKIFFVNGWLAAFLGGQCSPRALDTVNDFLRTQPQLDRDLRLKVLEAADALQRCVRVRARYAGEVPSTGRAAP